MVIGNIYKWFVTTGAKQCFHQIWFTATENGLWNGTLCDIWQHNIVCIVLKSIALTGWHCFCCQLVPHNPIYGNTTLGILAFVSIINTFCHLYEAYFLVQLNFYPRQVLAFGYCRCLRLSVCPSVRVCMCQSLACPRDNSGPFKLGSPNLKQRCKTPWLRFQMFDAIDLDLQGQISLKINIYLLLSLSTQLLIICSS